MNLSIGNCVKLKSGGPTMTITARTQSITTTWLDCQWFEGTLLKTQSFPEPTLKIASPQLTHLPLYNADPNCNHNTIPAPGGGIKCTKCKGWFCY